MSSRFAARERRVSAAIDQEFGERTFIIPKAAGEFFAAGADLSRIGIEVIGIVDFVPKVIIPRELGQDDGYVPQLAGDVIHVSYDASAFSIHTLPKEGDIIETLDRNVNLKFLVDTCEPDELGRIVAKVKVTS